MNKSTRETLYPGTRLSVHLTERGMTPDGGEPEQPNYTLIEALRTVRDEGYDSITAVERYDPDFSIDLSRARTEAEADALLERWHARRAAVLDETRAKLKRTWSDGRTRAGA
ncbi:hypothetical protein SAMN05216360_101500 [Methylobacterium phyllostachyos]|uniref:Uncharacterized protein n=1 Tax=Methylobacterium phyllostachyos TaxID=582672 RepID=A0A1G9S7G7_9HYPH|nr:hypothetical protein [Methylobacterium phyllostachyos]SDM30715.1 hypothetical protein SAMN05216360_101500 [Methylobacterium phyllostachyos]